MVEHIVLFRWTEEASQGAIDSAVAELRGPKGKIAGIVDLSCGANFSDCPLQRRVIRHRNRSHGIMRSLDPMQRGRDHTPAVHRTGTRAIGVDGPPSASESTQPDAHSHSHNCRRYYARACNAPKSHRQARLKLGRAPAIRFSDSPWTQPALLALALERTPRGSDGSRATPTGFQRFRPSAPS